MAKKSLKVLIFGQGYVAQALETAFELEDHEAECVRFELGGFRGQIKEADVIVNAVGFCGIANVSDCDLPAMIDRTIFANSTIPGMIAMAANDADKYFAHISSGCFWESQEDVEGLPTIKTTYAKSKWAGELAVKTCHSDPLIARIRMPFGSRDCRRNTLSKLISYPTVWDTNPFSMSNIDESSQAIVSAVEEGRTGVEHIVNPGSITNVEIAQIIENNLGVKKQTATAPPGCGRSFVVLEPSDLCAGMTPVKESVELAFYHWKWR